MAVTPAPVAEAIPAAPAIVELREHSFTAGEWIVLALIAVWIPLQLLAAWPAPLAPSLDGPWRYDPAMFLYEGELVRRGAMPYLSFWDHKGPLIYLIDAAGLCLSGGGIWGVWAAGVVATWLAAAFGYSAMRAAFGVAGALLGAVVFVFGLAGITTGANVTEQYALPLAWGAALVLVRWARTRCTTPGIGFALGALGTLAFLLRANLAGAATSAALTIAIVSVRERRAASLGRLAPGAAAGVAAAAGPIFVWLARGGALGAFWDQTITYNLLYANNEWTQRLFAAFAGIWLATATVPVVLPIAGVACCVRWLRRSSRADRSYPVMLFAAVWLAVELLLSCTSGRPYDHYFLMLLPPMAFVSAALVSEIAPFIRTHARRPDRWIGVTVTAVALVMVFPVVSGLAVQAARGGLVPDRDSSQVISAAEFVRANTKPDDALLVWGVAGGVYFLADRQPASRFLYVYPLLTRSYGASAVPLFLEDVRRTPPTLIVDASDSSNVPTLARWDPAWRFPRFFSRSPYWTMTSSLRAFYDFVERNYTPIATVGPERWTVYRVRVRPEER